jgi:hypothetical protein
MTIQDVEKAVESNGYTVSRASSWESESHIYAFSIESCGPETYGAPKCTACYYKPTKTLTIY